MDFVGENTVPTFDREDFSKYFKDETVDRAVNIFEGSTVATLREIAAVVIFQNSKSSSDKLDAFVPYLAMTYFDRFISRNQLPNVTGSVREDIVLAANCCLIIAGKMRDKSFSFHGFLAKNNLNREYYEKHTLKMELEILKGLEWRMRNGAMALCFVPYFLRESSVRGISRGAVNQIIIESQEDMSYTRFKSSVIAAAAVIVACRLLIREGNVKRPPHVRCRQSLLDTKYVNDEQVDRCSEKMLEMCMIKNMLMEGIEDFFQDPASKAGGERAPMAPLAAGGEASLSSRHEIEVVEPEIPTEAEAGMGFELKWLLDVDDPHHYLVLQLRNIDSFRFRPPAPAPDTATGATAEPKDKPRSTSRCSSKWLRRFPFKFRISH